MSKVEAKKNLAKHVETPQIPMLRQPKFYALPDVLRQGIVQALLTGSPKQLSVGEVNQICNALNQLRELKQSDEKKKEEII